MAKHHTKHHHRSASRAIVRVPTVKPIVIRQTKMVKAKKHHRGHKRGGIFSGIQTKQVIGGAALGFLKKQFPTLPTIPMLGQDGTIALIAYVMKGKVPFAEDVLNAALVIAGYQFASTGTIQGDFEGAF